MRRVEARFGYGAAWIARISRKRGVRRCSRARSSLAQAGKDWLSAIASRPAGAYLT